MYIESTDIKLELTLAEAKTILGALVLAYNFSEFKGDEEGMDLVEPMIQDLADALDMDIDYEDDEECDGDCDNCEETEESENEMIADVLEQMADELRNK